MKKRFNFGNIETLHGSTHNSFTLLESLNYIKRVFNDYLQYSDLSIDAFQGKKILEIGPGDNLGVALMFLASGASQVVTLDKFYSKRDEEKERKIYQKLREQLDKNARNSFDNAISLNSKIEINPDRLKCIYGYGIENTDNLFEHNAFDFVISRAVLEEIWDIDSAFSIMDRVLAPGGYLLHDIDLRDYGMFSNYGTHPLTFLTIPDFIYKLMVSDSGKPNRKLLDYYQEKMEQLGYDTNIFITHIVGVKDKILPPKKTVELNVDYHDSTIVLLNQIRPKLQPEFKKLSDKELMISGIFLVARKPQ